MLKRNLAKIEQRGWTFNVGPEPEFFLFRSNGDHPFHPVPHDVGSYFDFSANDEAVRVRTELMEALSGMGLEIEMGHHEEPQIAAQMLAAVPHGICAECFADPDRDPLWPHMLIDPPKIRDGTLEVPDRPGFGIRLDWAQLDRHRIA